MNDQDSDEISTSVENKCNYLSQLSSNENLTIVQLAEKIDELTTKDLLASPWNSCGTLEMKNIKVPIKVPGP